MKKYITTSVNRFKLSEKCRWKCWCRARCIAINPMEKTHGICIVHSITKRQQIPKNICKNFCLMTKYKINIDSRSMQCNEFARAKFYFLSSRKDPTKCFTIKISTILHNRLRIRKRNYCHIIHRIKLV